MTTNDDSMYFRCKTDDKLDWKAAAEKSGRSLSNWIVWNLNQAAERDLDDPKNKK